MRLVALTVVKQMLLEYYAKYDADKTEVDIDGIIEKRTSLERLLWSDSEEWFHEMIVLRWR